MTTAFDDFIRRIMRTIEDIGFFDRTFLAEKLGMSREQLDVFLREYFFAKSFAIRAYPNYARLGLRYTIVLLDFSFKWIDKARDFLDAMAREGFLVTWIKPFGGYTYLTHHTIPSGSLKDYKKFFDHLTDLGLLTGYRFYELDSEPEGFAYDPVVFDYRKGEWKERAEATRVERTLKEVPKEPFLGLDEMDLLILDRLQRSSLQSVDAMASSLNSPLEDVKFHLQNHVIGENLVKKYLLDIFNTEMLSPQTAVLIGLCEGIRGEQRDELYEYLLSHPYLGYINSDARTVEFALEMPWRVVPIFSTLLDKKVEEAKPAQYFFGTSVLGQIHTFTVPYEHYKGGKWSFNEEEVFNTYQRYLENQTL